VLLHAILIVGALATLVPLGWMVAASFMTAGEANSLPPRLLPQHPTLQNYVTMFTRLDLLKHFINSAIVTLLATVLSVLVNSLAGYAFAKLPFPGREKLFKSLAAALVVPAQVGMLPLFLLLMYFMAIRPEQKRKKEAAAMMGNLRSGDTVVTIGGMHGIVHLVEDRTVVLRVDSMKITVDKSAIARVQRDETARPESK